MSTAPTERTTGAAVPVEHARAAAPERHQPEPHQPDPHQPDPQRPELSVVVPLVDEAESLPQLLHEVRTALDPSVPGAPRSWELVLVDDGSRDGSWDVVQRLVADDERVVGLRLRRNFGKSAALAAGVSASRGELVAMMDADLQDDPAELPALLARIEAGADLVSGHKVDRKDPLHKRLPSRLYNRVTGLVTGLRLNDHNCGLKVARREVFEHLPLYGELHRYIAALAHSAGFAVEEKGVNHRARVHGRSKFGLERYARGALDLLTVVALTRFGRRPNHLLGGAGILLGVLGGAVLAYLAVVWAVTAEPIGDRPLLLAGVLLVLVGVQLVSLGILAELLVSRRLREDEPLRLVAEQSVHGRGPGRG
ncbi:glycosyltransferase family 2 protein [Thalassiella azotivora]